MLEYVEVQGHPREGGWKGVTKEKQFCPVNNSKMVWIFQNAYYYGEINSLNIWAYFLFWKEIMLVNLGYHNKIPVVFWVIWKMEIYFSLFWDLGNPKSRCQLIWFLTRAFPGSFSLSFSWCPLLGGVGGLRGVSLSLLIRPQSY